MPRSLWNTSALVIVAALGSPRLQAQGTPPGQRFYSLMTGGLSFGSRNYHGTMGQVGLHFATSSHLAIGADLAYHALTSVDAIYMTSPCFIPPCPGDVTGTPGRDLLTSQFAVEVFEIPERKGWFLNLGLGPGMYLTQHEPAQTSRWSCAASVGAGLALPFGPAVRLRLETRYVQLLQPASRPTRLLALGIGLQAGAPN